MSEINLCSFLVLGAYTPSGVCPRLEIYGTATTIRLTPRTQPSAARASLPEIRVSERCDGLPKPTRTFAAPCLPSSLTCSAARCIWTPRTSRPAKTPRLRGLLEQTLGTQRAKHDLTDSGQPPLRADANVVETVQLINRSGVIDLDHPGSAIAIASNDSINHARARTRLFTEGLNSFARVSGLRRNKDFAGLSVRREPRRD